MRMERIASESIHPNRYIVPLQRDARRLKKATQPPEDIFDPFAFNGSQVAKVSGNSLAARKGTS
jgi:hypothetical protein